jgi:hypothetical protein
MSKMTMMFGYHNLLMSFLLIAVFESMPSVSTVKPCLIVFRSHHNIMRKLALG